MASSFGDARLWQAVDALVDRAPRPSDLWAHGLEIPAARRWRALGRPVPTEFVEAERASAVGVLTAPLVLEKARAAYDGPLVLMKGIEAGMAYPDPVLRPFRDLDLLTDDPWEAQRALLAAGFELTGDPRLYVDIHHLRPLKWPSLPLIVELHSRPKWPETSEGPAFAELLEAAVPSATDVDGVLAPARDHHAVLVAAHSWAHVPLRKVGDLVDIAVVSGGLERSELANLARRWGIGRIWHTFERTTDALVGDARLPLALRLWAGNLAAVRERTVLEEHFERYLGGFAMLPAGAALRATLSSLAEDVRPTPNEDWPSKLLRSRKALRNAFSRLSDHYDTLPPEQYQVIRPGPNRGERT